ncbi:hypothetical protein TetV_343 [Tetraselmis virus 1]|uniref:Uncharacterized protein n=1 Tax=Tetraselmis virus 1 TaxID=2060617 RepID=A0A2P0VNE8_9VIRU|nr:hypothetical protein QJ968_gp343 [Tetraselmis virus 1]AUF82435.1 hypothetical protein TetV_343 [Tetraselmis virus 1]
MMHMKNPFSNINFCVVSAYVLTCIIWTALLLVVQFVLFSVPFELSHELSIQMSGASTLIVLVFISVTAFLKAVLVKPEQSAVNVYHVDSKISTEMMPSSSNV